MLSYSALKAARTALIAHESDLRYSTQLLEKIGGHSELLAASLVTVREAIEEIENVLLEVHADA